ncbi:MAG TPA: hypothetical protein VKU94_04545 [Geobacterales bacterium]|nr:hypothetical protein [Geobacterales bacterium]
MSKEELKTKGVIKVKLLGVLKGLAKVESIDLNVDAEGKRLDEILLELTQIFGEEFKNRIFQGGKISPDVLVNYKGKVFSIRNNEGVIIEEGSTITIFSFVHGG